MSLVSEALRKARQEAAERGAARKGVVIRTTVTLPSRRSGLAPSTAAVLGGVAVLLAVTVVLGWRALGNAHAGATAPTRGNVLAPASGPPASHAARSAPTPPEVAPSTPALPMTAPAADRPATQALAPTTSAAVAPAAPAPPRPGMSGDRAAPPAPAPASGESAALPAFPAEPVPAAPTTASGSVPALPQGPGDQGGEHERSFRLTAVVDGVTLTLDYIAYQPSKAFAGINGKEVVVGTVIEGVRVEEIGPDYVRLRDRHGPFYLRTE